ncbi:serine hydrolase domain-containing protein [Asaia sp. VD9]|uniref:serine hydrolase domain-containing protein n=1 Tax=Asaia sp. VD9 TaxID=3081235 RepID=UPI003016037F
MGDRNRVVHRHVAGWRALEPHREAMTLDTVFDMASLTKPLITAPCVMRLIETGEISLETKIATIFPDFAANQKGDITIGLLLTHYSGLPPDLPLDQNWSGRAEAFARACASPLAAEPSTRFIYSDINYLMLGFIVEKLTGESLDIYARALILNPLSMSKSGFRPQLDRRPSIAPTQYDETGVMLRGVVHDPTARRMNGVAGHAGLFSCAEDLVRYITALLDRRSGRESSFPLTQETVLAMTRPAQPARQRELRGLGWDIDTHYSTLRGERFPKNSFGHTGFTGPSLWVSPDTESYVLILTNRVHPRGGTSLVALRRLISTQTALALGIG